MTALSRTIEARVLVAVYAVVAVVCAFLPLADHLGFEFAAILTIVAALVAPFVGFAAMRAELATEPTRQRPARAAAQAGLFAALALVVPALLILVNAVRRPICDPIAGAIWMLLIPAPTAWLAATAGALTRLRITRVGWAIVVVAGVEVVLLLASIATLYFGPADYALDHFFGFYPGPLYDEQILITAALVSFRTATVLWGAAAVAAAGALGSADPAARRMHTSWAVALSIALVATSVGWGSALGWRTTEGALLESLSGEITIDHLILHFPRDIGDQGVDALMHDAAYAGDRVEHALGITPTHPVNVWVYRDAEQKRRLVGAAGTSFAKPWRHEVHINSGGPMRHELVHAMAADFARGPLKIPGFPGNATLVEGFAEAFDLESGSLTLTQEARAMRDAKVAPNLERLLSLAGFETEASSRAYTYSGAFIRYLNGRFGTAALRKLYFTGDLSILGDSHALIADFERMLDTVRTDANARSTAARINARPSLFGRRCAREVGAVVDSARRLSVNRQFVESMAMWDRACRLQPDDPTLVNGKLSLTIRMRPTDPSVILAAAESLWRHPRIDPILEATSRVSVGTEFWRRGDTATARAQFARAAALPADPATRRAIAMRLLVLADPMHAALLGPQFYDPSNTFTLALRLADTLTRHPNDALLLYFLAQQYQSRRGYDKAAEVAERADAIGLPNVELVRENLRRIIGSQTEMNRCDEGERVIPRLEKAGGSAMDVATATDAVTRCRFFVARGWKPAG